MEKVILTKYQVEALEEVKSKMSKSSAVEHHVDGWINSHLEYLNELSTDEFIRALYIGYEVKPEFKKGDKVVKISGDTFISGNLIETVESNEHNGEVWLECGSWMTTQNLRKATDEEIKQEKERRWWLRHNRQPWEFKVGDFLVNSDNAAYEVTKISEGYCYIHHTYFTYKNIKERFKVLCFVEDRKDLD